MMVFEFTSEGPKGNIAKIIKFSETALEGYYNLAFGDQDFESGELDDLAISNNEDSERVLATVISAGFSFTDFYENAWVYATGSTQSRTRLYRMGIAKYIDEAQKDFLIFGLRDGEWEEFEKNFDYTAFVVHRK